MTRPAAEVFAAVEETAQALNALPADAPPADREAAVAAHQTAVNAMFDLL